MTTIEEGQKRGGRLFASSSSSRSTKKASRPIVYLMSSLSLLGVGTKHSHFFSRALFFFAFFWTKKERIFDYIYYTLFVRVVVFANRERERETQRSKSDTRNVSQSCAVRLWRGRRRARVRRRRRRRQRQQQPLGRAFWGTKGDQRKMHSFFIQKREEDAEEKKAARRAR